MAGQDYCALQDVKSYLQFSSTDTQYDTLLSFLVTRASRVLDNYCQHPLNFIQESITETVRAKVDNTGALLAPAGKPIVTAVTSFGWTTSPSIAPNPINPSLLWIDNNYVVVAPDVDLSKLRGQRIRVTMTYTGGYNPLPDDIVHSAIVLAARFFKEKDAGFSDMVGVEGLGILQYAKVMPREIKQVLDNWKRAASW